MSVSSEITRLYGVRSDIFTAIEAKGVTVPSGSELDDCPTLIGQISGTPAPPSLAANTVRLQYADGFTPTSSRGTFTQVTSSPNVWDFYSSGFSWSNIFQDKTTLVSVIAWGDMSGVTEITGMFQGCTALGSVVMFNTQNITNFANLFNGCKALYSVPQFATSSATSFMSTFQNCATLASAPVLDTSNATNLSNMFSGCAELIQVPLLNTSKATNVSYMFSGCFKVQSGALALYQQASTQTTPPSNTAACFRQCGRDTTTGSAELAQIPTSWGGTMS